MEVDNIEVFGLLQANISKYVLSCLQASAVSILKECGVKITSKDKLGQVGESESQLTVEGDWSEILAARQCLIKALTQMKSLPPARKGEVMGGKKYLQHKVDKAGVAIDSDKVVFHKQVQEVDKNTHPVLKRYRISGTELLETSQNLPKRSATSPKTINKPDVVHLKHTGRNPPPTSSQPQIASQAKPKTPCSKCEVCISIEGHPLQNNACKACGKIQQLVIMTNSHKNESATPGFACDICGLRFNDQGPLSNHRKVHDKEVSQMEFTVVSSDKSSSHDLLSQSNTVRQNFTCDKRAESRYQTCNLCGEVLRGVSKAFKHLEQRHVKEFMLAMSTESSQKRNSSTSSNEIGVLASPLEKAENSNLALYPNLGKEKAPIIPSSQPIICEQVVHTNDNKLLSLASALASIENLTGDIPSTVISSADVIPDGEPRTETFLSEITLHPKRTLMVKNPLKAIAKCQCCGFKTSHAGLIHHMKRYHATKLYTCPLCPRKFGMFSDLARHHRNHFSASGKRRPLNWRIGYRYRRDGQSPLHHCDVCKRGFYRKVDLTRHHASHFHASHPVTRQRKVSQKNKFGEIALLQCPSCEYRTNTSYRLTLHHQRAHMSQTSPSTKSDTVESGKVWLSCGQCSKKFESQESLDQHTQVAHTTHEPTKNSDSGWECSICGRMFKQRRYLHDHILRHTGTKRHFCPVCNKGFLEHYKMLQHKEIHKEEGRSEYTCKYCGRGFRARSYLNDHENTHTGHCPYTCSVCGRSFTLASALSRHKLQHTSKSFLCTHQGCSKSFRLSSQLKLHMNLHTPEHHFKCPHCNRQYARQATLRHHRCKAAIKDNGGDIPQNTVAEVLQDNSTKQNPSALSDSCLPPECDNQTSKIVDVSAILPSIPSPLPLGTDSEKNCIYVCSVCNMTFSEWNQINIHMTQHRDVDDHAFDHNISTVTLEANVVHEETIQLSEVEPYPTVQIVSDGGALTTETVIMMPATDVAQDGQNLELHDFPVTLSDNVTIVESVMVPMCDGGDSSNSFPSDFISPVEYQEISTVDHITDTTLNSSSGTTAFIP